MSSDFLKKYEFKLKMKSEIPNIVGKYPRNKKIILCHGVFDVVHPGHVRHLAYAKSKADILIASVTEDRFINKGTYRPHIPEKIRALNLAAFEMVDYVFVDDQATPLSSLDLIKPDFFAKGFEYTSNNLPTATLEEKEVVEKYGGQMLFTPGDIVYSSSKFIDLFAPRIELEKLTSLMETEKITFSNLKNIIKNLKNHSVHVVGDTIVDTYTRTTLIGGQTKTPTFSVLKEQEDNYIGGAAIVARHISATGAQVYFSTVLGDDNHKDFVLDGLKETNITILPIIDSTRPTTNKNVFISSGYRLLKVDTLDNRPIFQNDINEISNHIKNTKARAIVFSDFRHGIFSKQSITQLVSSIPKNLFSVADSQVASRWGNIVDFKGFDLITPNEREARFAIADQDSTVGSLSGKICSLSKCKLLFLKLGEKGLFVNKPDAKNEKSYFSIDSFSDHIADAVGAGDALLAYATLSLLENKSVVAAAIIGSIAAACECEYDGNIPITPEKVLDKLNSIEKRINYG
jgi:rfaE bifunctional protein kinase chain/domain/rfaE bifunctional protein nucleotidyltransferase chain/domain